MICGHPNTMRALLEMKEEKKREENIEIFYSKNEIVICLGQSLIKTFTKAFAC